jgi:hypothetical protein
MCEESEGLVARGCSASAEQIVTGCQGSDAPPEVQHRHRTFSVASFAQTHQHTRFGVKDALSPRRGMEAIVQGLQSTQIPIKVATLEDLIIKLENPRFLVNVMVSSPSLHLSLIFSASLT